MKPIHVFVGAMIAAMFTLAVIDGGGDRNAATRGIAELHAAEAEACRALGGIPLITGDWPFVRVDCTDYLGAKP